MNNNNAANNTLEEQRQKEVDEIAEKEGLEKWPSPSNPRKVAKKFLQERYQRDDVLTLRSWCGSWVKWNHGLWTVAEDTEISDELGAALEDAIYSDAGREWHPTQRKIADVERAIKAITRLHKTVEPGDWIGNPEEGPAPGEVLISVKNGNLLIPERKLTNQSPNLFNLVQVPFAYDPEAAAPQRWNQFLEEIWPGDNDSIRALQEWFGYVISGRTDLHKMLLLVGPPRAGKSVLGRVVAGLVGRANVSSPSLATLGTDFGLQPLIGKTLAIIPEARLGRGTNQIVEKLLTLSGEDMVNVNRKYMQVWTGQMTARFMIISNEIPRLGDASGAIAKRFVLLRLPKGVPAEKQDPGLTKKLISELEGIFVWALDGLDRLNENGAFTQPAASREAIATMEDLASPVAAFARECCIVGPGHEISTKALFTAYKEWCEANERHPGPLTVFGRDLSAAFPEIRRARPWTDGHRPHVFTGIALEVTETGPGRDWATGDPSLVATENDVLAMLDGEVIASPGLVPF